MRNNDLDILISLGLNKTEATIYIDLIKNSNSPVSDISKRTKIHRPNVYDAIRRLKERELVTEIIDNGSKLFNALNPENLKFYLARINKNVDKLIEDLKKIPKRQEQEKLLSLFEGAISVKAELMDLLNLKKPIFIAFNNNSSFVTDPEFLDLFNQRRIQKNIPLRIICLDSNPFLEKMSKLPCTEIRVLDKKANSSFVTSIFVGDAIYFFTQKDEKEVLIKISEKNISEQQKKHFEYAWNLSPKM